MKKRFVYFYTLKPEPERIQPVVAEHVSYWESLSGRRVRGGTFDNLSGGLMCFDADSIHEARRVVENDPFLHQGLISDHSVLEWVITSD